MNETKRPLFVTDLGLGQVEELLVSMGEPAWRAKVLLSWVYSKKASSFENITDFPKALRQKFSERITLSSTSELNLQVSRDGTRKATLELWDGRVIETVLIPSLGGRYSVCVSSQVGCAVGCPFCKTGQGGYERNLGIAEICDQVLYFARQLTPEESIGNVVFMGMGEPMANYLDVIASIRNLNAPWGFGLGARNITVSTAGHIPGIEKLGKECPQVGLAVSLHAANNQLRNKLVPMNKKYPLPKLINACQTYFATCGRRVTFEYCLFDGVNDSLEDARQLAHLVSGLNCHINLLVANVTGSNEWLPPSKEKVIAFEAELKRLRVVVTVRKSYGGDIKAACGQLSRND